MAYSSSCRFALLRLRAALFLFASVFNYLIIVKTLHYCFVRFIAINRIPLMVTTPAFVFHCTYGNEHIQVFRAVKNIMFAGVFMCPKNRTEVNISPVCRGRNAQNRAVNDTGRLRDTPR